MKKITIAFLSLCSAFLTTPAFSDVSVHVLDTNKGQPAQGIEVQFFEKKNEQWRLLETKITDDNGRIKSFGLRKSLVYRVVFNVAPFFENQKINSFYSNIPVDFKVDNEDAHYHIPLLLSPYAYSTYRGN